MTADLLTSERRKERQRRHKEVFSTLHGHGSGHSRGRQEESGIPPLRRCLHVRAWTVTWHLANNGIDTGRRKAGRHTWETRVVRPVLLRELELVADIAVEGHEQEADVFVRLVVNPAVIRIVRPDAIRLAASRHEVLAFTVLIFEPA